MDTAAPAFFPLDERWGIGQSVYSPERVKQMVWLAAVVPYAQAVEVFKRIGHWRVPLTSPWEQTQAVGAYWQTQQAQAQSQVSVKRVILPPAGQDHSHRKGVSLDGGTVNVRGEGWKEIKVGTVESGIKQFKHRLTGAGMRWSRPGVERMVLVRAAVLSHNFDQAWAAVLN